MTPQKYARRNQNIDELLASLVLTPTRVKRSILHLPHPFFSHTLKDRGTTSDLDQSG